MEWRASIVAADSNTVLAAVIPTHALFAAHRAFCRIRSAPFQTGRHPNPSRRGKKPAALGGQLLLPFMHSGALICRHVSPPPRLGGDAAAVGHPAISGQPGAMPNDGTGADT